MTKLIILSSSKFKKKERDTKRIKPLIYQVLFAIDKGVGCLEHSINALRQEKYLLKMLVQKKKKLVCPELLSKDCNLFKKGGKKIEMLMFGGGYE